MSERITDKRLAEIASYEEIDSYAYELLDYLIDERAEVEYEHGNRMTLLDNYIAMEADRDKYKAMCERIAAWAEALVEEGDHRYPWMLRDWLAAAEEAVKEEK